MKKKIIDSQQKRDTSKDKKRIKKIFIVVISALLALALLAGGLSLIAKWLYPDVETEFYDDYRFFEPDYSKNILEDKVYLSLRRGINYNRYGDECVLTKDNLINLHSSAEFFYNYFDNIIRGDYQNHTSFYTQEYLNTEDSKKVFPIPDKFTMQGIYDIHVNLYSSKTDEENKNKVTEIYEISYRIFENNGTFRRDILPDDTQTLVYEIYIIDGVAKINSIAYRTNG